MKLLLSFSLALPIALTGMIANPDLPNLWTSYFGDETPGYVTAKVTVEDISRSVVATGNLQAVATVEISSQLSGQISEVSADFNDVVRAGTALAVLDQRGFQAKVTQARAELQMARENVALIEAKIDRVREAENEAIVTRDVFAARVRQAEIRAENAAARLARADRLSTLGATSGAGLEDAQAENAARQAELAEAQAQARAHQHVVSSSAAARRETEAELRNFEAGLPLREAALTLAELDLERSVIRSPIDGIVIGRNVEPGQTVAASLDAPVLFTIAGDLSKMEIHANIDETDIGLLAVGQKATFSVDAYPSESFAATVSEIRKSARRIQSVVSYTVVLEAGNPTGRLLPGMTSTVTITVERSGPSLTLPLSALSYRPEEAEQQLKGPAIWVLDQAGHAIARRVELGTDDGRRIAVSGGGLRPGDRVIVGQGVTAPANKTPGGAP
ncbi:efflux RND transporter periplasmic adaptor subunit [Leisingera caerulea]|uniref:Efflux RND transporter periplasmic adaptor subunit n=1 Tax=Leisingera caerulea TaxID=506591 RepID=A0A9Q9HP66_LEICA|nr:efflux RND transporter periplasmic adaptor subunit [Leisingera caerulea]UWQ55950.1 efflux RND transporter periplasmic adaptor subunit [Leisingera caerulea]